MQYLYVIDNTGFAKNVKTEVSNNEENPIVGCLIPLNKLIDVAIKVFDTLKIAERKYNIKEFNFEDMYNKVNGFENITAEDMLFYVNSFVNIINKFDIKIVSTNLFQEISRDKNFIEYLNKEILGNAELSTQNYRMEEYGFVLNLKTAKQYVYKISKSNEIVEIMCDENLKTDKIVKEIKLNGKDKESVKLTFRCSAEYPYLQVSNFAGFALARLKYIQENEKCEKLDTLDKVIFNSIGTQIKNV